MKFYYYIFYKIARFYLKIYKPDNIFYGRAVVSAVEGFYILSLLQLILWDDFARIILHKWLLIIIYVLLCVLNTHILPRKKYVELCKKYKNEKHKKLKGWLVFFVVLSSLAAYTLAIIYVKNH